MGNSARGLETCLEVLPSNFKSFRHPTYTQKHFFGILGQVLQCDYVLDDNGILPKKTPDCVDLKKTLLFSS